MSQQVKTLPWAAIALVLVTHAPAVPAGAAATPQLVVQTGHTAAVRSLAFSPDGRRLASGGKDGAVKLWNPATGQLQSTFEAYDDEVTSVTFSRDGRYLAATGSNGGEEERQLKRWDTASGHPLGGLNAGSGDYVAYSPDGKRLLSTYTGIYDLPNAPGGGSPAGAVRLWDPINGSLLKTLDAGVLKSLAFSPDGKLLVTGAKDGTLALWNPISGTRLKNLDSHSPGFVAFSPDGKRFASGGGMDGGLKLWQAGTGKLLTTINQPAYAVAFSPDGKRLASGSLPDLGEPPRGTVNLWDAVTGKRLKELVVGGCVGSLAFSADGKRLATLGNCEDAKTGQLMLWDTATGKLSHTLASGGVDAIAISPDRKFLASGSHDGVVKLWDAVSGRLLVTFANHALLLHAQGEPVALSPGGEYMATAGCDKDSDGSCIAGRGKLVLRETGTGRLLKALKNLPEQFQKLIFSPDGKRLATGSPDGKMSLWEVASGQRLATLNDAGLVRAVAFSPDDQHLVTGGQDGTVTLRDGTGGKRLRSLQGHFDRVTSLAFSPDGSHVAAGGCTIKTWEVPPGDTTSGCKGGAVDLWDVASGQPLATWNPGWVTAVAFSPNGKLLATVSCTDNRWPREDCWAGQLDLWDTASGKSLKKWTSEWGPFLSFSPDGKRLASGIDRVTQLWDVASGRPLRKIDGIGRFSADGKRLVAAGKDGTVKQWDVQTGRVILTLQTFAQDNWVVYAPDGRVDASPGATRHITWRVGKRVYDFAKFKDRFYVPNLWARIWKGT